MIFAHAQFLQSCVCVLIVRVYWHCQRGKDVTMSANESLPSSSGSGSAAPAAASTSASSSESPQSGDEQVVKFLEKGYTSSTIIGIRREVFFLVKSFLWTPAGQFASRLCTIVSYVAV